jgi:membrane-associated phospholipid phosphatase
MINANASNKAKRITIRLLFSAGIFLVCLFIFFFIIHEVLLEKETHLDEKIFLWIGPYRTPLITKLMLFVTFFGSQKFLLPAYVLLTIYALLIKKDSRLSFDITAISLAGTGFLFVMKDYFQRIRPAQPVISNVGGFSFPSGHSFSVFTFFGILAYICWQSQLPKKWKVFLLFIFTTLSLLVAFSRVYLQVHYASDVVAGLCLSLAWLTSSFYLFSQLNGYNHSPSSQSK